jgi:hypothetical protein
MSKHNQSGGSIGSPFWTHAHVEQAWDFFGIHWVSWKALLSRSVQTCYGLLSFDNNGQTLKLVSCSLGGANMCQQFASAMVQSKQDGCEVPGPMLALWLSRRFGKFWQNQLQMEKWDAEMLLKHVETMYQMYQARPSFVSVGRFNLWTRTRHVGFWIRINGAVGVVGCWWLVTGPGDHGSLDQRRHCDSGLRRPWPQTAGTEPEPEARHEIRGESSCISMYSTCIFRYITVCHGMSLFVSHLLDLAKDDKDD